MRMETPADVAALAPWLLGYELGRNDVAVVTLDRDSTKGAAVGPTVMFPCDELGARLEAAVAESARRVGAEIHGRPLAFAIGYGDNGDVVAAQVAEYFEGALPVAAETIPLHYDGSQVQMIATDGRKIGCGPLPDVSAEMTGLGMSTPSASRRMKDREWEPDPVPSYGLLNPAIAGRLEHFPPTERAEEAVRIARVLADGQSRSVSGDQTRLAGLMNSSTSHWVSDRLLMESCTASTPAMADALRRLYVQAPPEYQQAIAGVAAVAHYAQYGNSQALRAVSAQLDPDGPGRADAKMVRVLSQTLPEFKKFQAQVARGAERAKDMDLGSSKDRGWRQTRHDEPQVSDGRRAIGPAGDANRETRSGGLATPPQVPGTEQGPPPGPSGPSMT